MAFWAGQLLLLCLLALSYNRYRLKQRSNQLLEIKQHEINRKNQTLETLLSEQQQLLTEKEWMLKEIHHRVKNNLQIITSLLHSQGVFLKDEAAQSAIRESQNRVHAMALIHQKLYQSDRLAAIPMAGYVAEIVDYLIKSFDREGTIRKRDQRNTARTGRYAGGSVGPDFERSGDQLPQIRLYGW